MDETNNRETRVTIGVDPGSKTSGVAVLHGHTLKHWELVTVPASRPPLRRCCDMAEKVEETIVRLIEATPRDEVSVVMELPGKQGKFHSRGLVTLGMVVGMVLTRIQLAGFSVKTTEATEWTRLDGKRNLSKEARTALVSELYPNDYDVTQDKGMDGADAIGLAAWSIGYLTVSGGKQGIEVVDP